MSDYEDTYPEVHQRAVDAAAPKAGTIVFLHGGNVANWMWDPQVKALGDYRILTPDLPGFGSRAAEEWTGLAATADAVATFIAEHAGPDPVHVVGLSMGAVVALHLIARHPGVAASALVSGAVLSEVRGPTRWLSSLQFSFWERAWFWRGQAWAFRLPKDSVGLYVRHGLSVRRSNAERMLREVYAGAVPEGLSLFPGRLLAVAGEKEPAMVSASFATLGSVLHGAEFRRAKGVHHVWNVENAELFTAMVRHWAEGKVHPELLPALPGVSSAAVT
jgi:pimeloyl-ACP methyl ester carboxylesterase